MTHVSTDMPSLPIIAPLRARVPLSLGSVAQPRKPTPFVGVAAVLEVWEVVVIEDEEVVLAVGVEVPVVMEEEVAVLVRDEDDVFEVAVFKVVVFKVVVVEEVRVVDFELVVVLEDTDVVVAVEVVLVEVEVYEVVVLLDVVDAAVVGIGPPTVIANKYGPVSTRVPDSFVSSPGVTSS